MVSTVKENVAKLNNCFGCSACASVCPKGIINMSEIDGFLQPEIYDVDNCIECGICLKVCSYNITSLVNPPQNLLHAYAATNIDLDVIKDSSSGGISSELINTALNLGMSAIGVQYNYQTDKPEHYIINELAEANKARGSKYLQSNLSYAMTNIDWSKKYIVFGTPCQIASLYQYVKLRKKEANFIFVDYFCHGVPSYKLWRSYLKMLKIDPGTIKYVKFRTKDYGWQNSTKVFIEAKDKTIKPNPIKKDIFFKWFLGDRCLLKACYDSCQFKQLNSFTDIRIGDLWGSHFKEDKMGVSGILTLTKKGQEFLDQCNNISKTEVEPAVVLEGQMKANARRSKSYKVANIGLNRHVPLKTLNFVCDLIDNTYTLPKRLSRKIKSIKKNRKL